MRFRIRRRSIRNEGEAATYRVPYNFDEVQRTRNYWEKTRDKLLNPDDLANALGMVNAPNRPKPVLVLPEPNGIDSNLLPTSLWTALTDTYPRQSENYAEWELWRFPDPARTELAKRAESLVRYRCATRSQVDELERHERARKEVSALLSQPVMREWGRLLYLLARLQDPDLTGPGHGSWRISLAISTRRRLNSTCRASN